jgi:hypothetical protein
MNQDTATDNSQHLGRTPSPLRAEGVITRAIGVYLGTDRQRFGETVVMPLGEFVEEPRSERVFG